MKMPAFAKKSASGRDADEAVSDWQSLRSQRWPARATGHRPLAARQDIEAFEGVNTRAANDEGARAYAPHRFSPRFVGSRHFWAAVIATAAFCVIFAAIMGFTSGTALMSLLRNPVQYSPFLLSLLVIASIQWLLAMSAHRQSVTQEMWRRMMTVTRRFNDPSPAIEDSARTMTASIDRLIADLDQRMATLDERTGSLSHQISAIMEQAAVSADLNVAQMKSIAESTETQRDSLQRVSATISTEVLPVINKLETTVAALENASQNAGSILGTLGAQLQQSTGELQVCLDEFNRANHNVAPEIEKRVARFEATISRLPDQIETTLTRLSPMSETIADAAMLSTANVEVMEQLARQITEGLQGNRAIFKDFATSNTELMKQAVDKQVERFRDLLTATIAEEAARVSQLSLEIGLLTETAAEVVTRLQHPVDQVTAAADKTLAEMDAAFSHLDQRIDASLSARVAELNQAASEIVNVVNREIESAAAALQTGLAASSSNIVEQVTAETSRFGKLIEETAEQSTNRIVSTIRDLPAEISHRMDEEIARVDVSLQGSVLGLSDQVQSIIDGIPARLASVTRDTIESLEGDLARSFDGVAQRSQVLSQDFRKNATETTEAVLENYVDFIFLALNRFRSEMEELNGSLRKELQASPPVKPEQDDRAAPSGHQDKMDEEPGTRVTADAE